MKKLYIGSHKEKTQNMIRWELDDVRKWQRRIRKREPGGNEVKWLGRQEEHENLRWKEKDGGDELTCYSHNTLL